jgi:hypothetical protein
LDGNVVADVHRLQHGEGGWLRSIEEGVGCSGSEEEECPGD